MKTEARQEYEEYEEIRQKGRNVGERDPKEIRNLK